MDELETEDLFSDVQIQIWAAEGLCCVGNIENVISSSQSCEMKDYKTSCSEYPCLFKHCRLEMLTSRNFQSTKTLGICNAMWDTC